MPTAGPGRKLYGRRVGHSLRPLQRARLDEQLPAIEVGAEGPPLDPSKLFASAQEIWLEIGFGAGEHLAWQAAHSPQAGLIGVEPFLNGVAACLQRLEEARISNVRICMDDANLFLERLADCCLDRVFILHPDPWPKARHHKRRLVQPDFLTELGRVMKPGAQLRLGTDWPDYTAWSLRHLIAHPNFEWLAMRCGDWQNRPSDWPITRYAKKATREGRRDAYLTFLRTTKA